MWLCSLDMCPTPSGHVSADMADVCNNCSSMAVTEDEGRDQQNGEEKNDNGRPGTARRLKVLLSPLLFLPFPFCFVGRDTSVTPLGSCRADRLAF